MPGFSLISCDADGNPLRPIAVVAPAISATYVANAQLYQRVGFMPPWTSYVAVDGDRAVGGGAFVGPPRENCVEIAYFTLKELEGRGYASRTAAELIRIARAAEPSILISALTLPELNASAKILTRLGFSVVGNLQDPDAGEVWQWRMG